MRGFDRSLFIRVLLLALGLPALAAGQIVLDPGDTAAVHIDAPQLFTRAISVYNTSADTQDCRERISLPYGWRVVAADTLFSLPPHGRDMRFLCLSIPPKSEPGLQTVEYAVYDPQSDSLLSRVTIPLHIRPALRLSLTVQNAPRRVLAGEKYTVSFLVAGIGNVPCSLELHAHTSSGQLVHLPESQIQLEPGESKVVLASIETDRTLKQTEQQWLVLRAENTDEAVRTAAQTAMVVEVIPRPFSGEDIYHRIPSHAAVRYVGADEQNGVQMELGGSGTLDAKGNYRVDYLARGPYDLERHLYGLRDEYYASVQSRDGEIRAGDLLFGLSQLSDRNRIGRGAKASFKRGMISAGGYAMQNRSKYPDLSEKAAYLGIAPRIPVQLKLGLLDKRTSQYHRNLLILSGSTTALRHMTIASEISTAKSLKNSRATTFAVWNNLGVELPLQARFSAEQVHAEPGFPGYFRDQDYTNLSLYVPLVQKLRWQTTFRHLAQNSGQDSSRSIALRESQFLTGLSYPLPYRAQVSLDLENADRRDALQPVDFDTRERSASLRVRQPSRWFTVSAAVRRGWWKDLKAHRENGLERYHGSLTITPDSRQNYSISYQTGHSGAQSLRSRIFSVSGNCRVVPGLMLSASWQTCRFAAAAPYENDQISFDARYTLFRRHTLSLRYRSLDFQQDYLSRGSSWMIGYELPMGLPVGRQDKYGCVKGHIKDSENMALAGVPGVVLMLDGKTVLTDNKGRFAFSTVKPGVHYLQLEKSSIGLDRVTTRRVPMELRVRGGHTEEISLSIVRGASLRGEMAVYGIGSESSRGIFIEKDSAAVSSSADSLELLYMLGGVEIVLRSQTETRRVFTDRNGNFALDELVPGRWEMTISADHLPRFHRPEYETYEVLLEPASSERVVVRILPMKRSVIIVDEGKVPVVTKRK